MYIQQSSESIRITSCSTAALTTDSSSCNSNNNNNANYQPTLLQQPNLVVFENTKRPLSLFPTDNGDNLCCCEDDGVGDDGTTDDDADVCYLYVCVGVYVCFSLLMT